MNQFHLGFRLGDVNPPAYQRFHNERLIYSLEHNPDVAFNFAKAAATTSSSNALVTRNIAHSSSVNCLAISNYEQGASHLATGGGDASIRLWDLNSTPLPKQPLANLSRQDESSHKHAISSLSIYPFDPEPGLLISTSFDKTLKLTSITPSSLQVGHTFDLPYQPYTHAPCPSPSSASLIAVGTAHPAITLLDLRSSFPLHSLPGHNDSIYSLVWHPTHSHILVSGSADNRVLFFDVRRANAAFASLDLDDAVGLTIEKALPSVQTVNRKVVAHEGPVTSVQFVPSDASKLVTAGHDQRIRLWDTSTGRNELVHFGPRIKNSRIGNLAPLLAPAGYAAKSSRELLFWPNDDGKGDVHVYSLREGQLVRIMRLSGVDRADEGKKGNVGVLTSAGRINGMVWRERGGVGGGEGLEMYSAHGDGRVGVWQTIPDEEAEVEETEDGEGQKAGDGEDQRVVDEEENRRKRKRELLEGLQGLTGRQTTFS